MRAYSRKGEKVMPLFIVRKGERVKIKTYENKIRLDLT